MKFSAALANLFVGVAVAGPLAVRDPQRSRHPVQINDLLPPNQGSEGIDPEFAKSVLPSSGPKNSQGFTQQDCDAIRNGHGQQFAEENFGVSVLIIIIIIM